MPTCGSGGRRTSQPPIKYTDPALISQHLSAPWKMSAPIEPLLQRLWGRTSHEDCPITGMRCAVFVSFWAMVKMNGGSGYGFTCRSTAWSKCDKWVYQWQQRAVGDTAADLTGQVRGEAIRRRGRSRAATPPRRGSHQLRHALYLCTSAPRSRVSTAHRVCGDHVCSVK